MKRVIADLRNAVGDGVNAFIKDDKFVVVVTDDGGMSGGEFVIDIDNLLYEIERYKLTD